MSGQLFIVSAPSGGGKTSLVEALLREDAALCASVSHTTRKARPGEVHGKDYYFVDEKEFEGLIQAKAFLEHAKVFGHRYGTSWDSVQKILDKGFDAILEIDWQGARIIRAQMACVSIFILPPARETLLERLTQRAQDSTTVIEKRMQQAADEMRHYDEYDYVVINDQFDVAVDDLKTVIRAGRLKTERQAAQFSMLIKSLLA